MISIVGVVIKVYIFILIMVSEIWIKLPLGLIEWDQGVSPFLFAVSG